MKEKDVEDSFKKTTFSNFLFSQIVNISCVYKASFQI